MKRAKKHQPKIIEFLLPGNQDTEENEDSSSYESSDQEAPSTKKRNRIELWSRVIKVSNPEIKTR